MKMGQQQQRRPALLLLLVLWGLLLFEQIAASILQQQVLHSNKDNNNNHHIQHREIQNSNNNRNHLKQRGTQNDILQQRGSNHNSNNILLHKGSHLNNDDPKQRGTTANNNYLQQTVSYSDNQQNQHSDGDLLHHQSARTHKGIDVDFGRKSFPGKGNRKNGETPKWEKIRKLMEEKRARRERGEVSESKSFIPLSDCLKTESCRKDGESATAGVLGTLSEKGLEYVKEVMVGQVLEEVTPLAIADIVTTKNSPIGRVDTIVNHIVLTGAQIYYSDIDLGESGITIYAAGISAGITMHWDYEYRAQYIPFPIGDQGRAEVGISGMQAGVTFTLTEQNGTLGLVVEEAGTYIEDLDIIMHGGASWLYQWFVYAFEYNIRASVEVAITNLMVKSANTFDNWLLNLPRAVPIDETSAIDVTVVRDPLLSPTFLSVGAKGEFISLDSPKEYPEPNTQIPAGLFCDQSVKMLTIALSDYVLNSAAFVYYDSGEFVWDVDNLASGTKYLNTKSWRYIIPKLYKQYPNDDMILNFAVSSAPNVDITQSGIRAQAGAEMTIEVIDGDTIVPVACIGLTVSFNAVAHLNSANVTGEASLDQLTLSLKWSDIGSFPVILVQATVKAIVQDVVLPIINLSLKQGFPVPMISGVSLENADLRYEDGYLLVCSDIRYTGGYFKGLQQKVNAGEHWAQ